MVDLAATPQARGHDGAGERPVARGRSNIQPVASERLKMSSSGCFLSMTAESSSTAARRAGRPAWASRAAGESRVSSSKAHVVAR